MVARRAIGAIGIGALLGAALVALVPRQVPPPPDVAQHSPRAISASFASLPLAFERNDGQWHKDVRFAAHGRGGAVWLSATGWAFGGADAHVKARLIGASGAALPSGEGALAGRVSYFLGDEPEKWVTGIPLFAEVRYPEVYPGIDLVFHGSGRQVELDFVVNPGGRPDDIRVALEGTSGLDLDPTGNLHVRTARRETVWMLPVVYQERDGRQERVQGSFEVFGLELGFRVGTYDVTRQLVIDPILEYSTYLGGSADESLTAVALDPAGNVYVAGLTNSSNWPLAGPVQSFIDGGYDAFVAKLGPMGSPLIYSTYLGGKDDDRIEAIAVDADGGLYLAGETSSSNFPTRSALQPLLDGGSDGFVAKLDPLGSSLVFSTFLGGRLDDAVDGIALDPDAGIYVTGTTRSTNFPTRFPFQGALDGGRDCFVSKLNPSGASLAYSTYFGGRADEGCRQIAVDSNGSAYIASFTQSTNLPMRNALQPTFDGGTYDAYAAKLTPTGNDFVYCTYLGSKGSEAANALAIDGAGALYLAGIAWPEPYDAGSEDVWVMKLGPSGSTIGYSRTFGGGDKDWSTGIAVDSAGNAYLAGVTQSTDFPKVGPGQSGFGGAALTPGSRDSFAAKLDPTGATLAYSTFLGGASDELAWGLALGPTGRAYVVGDTRSTDFPTPSALQGSYDGGPWDGFLAIISPLDPDAGDPDAGDSDAGVLVGGCGCRSSPERAQLAWLACAVALIALARKLSPRRAPHGR